MMRGVNSARLLIPLALGVGVVVALLSLSAVLWPGRASAQPDHAASIGVDADPTGNTATLLGERDTCIAVQEGDSFQVDVIVEDVEDLIAWEVYLSFDPSLIQVTDRDVHHFLDAVPNSSPFDLSESVPDDDGRYRVGAASIADPPVGGSGSGVLARLSVKAMGPGVATLSVAPIQTDVGKVAATLTAADGTQIGGSDGFFNGPMFDAEVAIGEPCPGAEGSTSADSVIAGDGGGGGVAVWVFAAAAAGVVATVGVGGGLVLMARRRASAG